MLARLPAMVQHIGMDTAGVFQRVGQDRQAVEGAVVVNPASHAHHTFCSANCRLAHPTKRVAEQTTQNMSLVGSLSEAVFCNTRRGGADFFGISRRRQLVANFLKHGIVSRVGSWIIGVCEFFLSCEVIGKSLAGIDSYSNLIAGD